MKKRNMIILLIILLTIGFASVSTTLVLNGTIGIGLKGDDFEVIFTKAYLDGQESSQALISSDKKTITFNTDKLTSVGDTAVLDYKVKNNSTQYGASVTINCTSDESEYINVESTFAGSSLPLLLPIEMKPQETKDGKIIASLTKSYAEEDNSVEVKCQIKVNALEEDELVAREKFNLALNYNDSNIQINDIVDETIISKDQINANAKAIRCNGGVKIEDTGSAFKISNIYENISCNVYDSVVTAFENIDDSKNYIMMLDNELDITESKVCYDANNITGICLPENKNVELDLNGKKIVSSTQVTLRSTPNSILKITGNGYIGNNYGTDGSTISVQGSKLNIESSQADKCTSNPSDTTSGLCLFGYYAINSWNAETKSSSYLKSFSINGMIGIRNGDADLYNLNVINSQHRAISIWDTANKVSINGGYYESLKENAINITATNAIVTINDYPTYIKTNRDLGDKWGIYNSNTSKVIINGTNANACTSNPSETISGLCFYGTNGINNALGEVTIKGGTFMMRIDATYNRKLMYINDGIFVSDNTKALTTNNYYKNGAVTYVNGGYFENKNLGETISNRKYSVSWGAIANEDNAITYIKNANVVGKYPLRGEKTGNTYICNANLKSTDTYDILVDGPSNIYYSNLVKFTDGSNTPKVTGTITGVIEGNYTGTCVP